MKNPAVIYQITLLLTGTLLLTLGLSEDLLATWDPYRGIGITYNDQRVAGAVNAILTYLEGSFGALIMVGGGLLAIISAAFGQYRTAIGCLIVAVGSFILRSVISTFFNDGDIMA